MYLPLFFSVSAAVYDTVLLCVGRGKGGQLAIPGLPGPPADSLVCGVACNQLNNARGSAPKTRLTRWRRVFKLLPTFDFLH